MIIGQTLYTTASGDVYFSPWFPRQGNAASMICNVIAFSSDLSDFSVQVQTKNTEQSDKDATGFTAKSITLTANTNTQWEVGAVDLDSAAVAGCLELVRFKYTLTSSEPQNLPAWIHFRMLNPSWTTN